MKLNGFQMADLGFGLFCICAAIGTAWMLWQVALPLPTSIRFALDLMWGEQRMEWAFVFQMPDMTSLIHGLLLLGAAWGVIWGGALVADVIIRQRQKQHSC